MKIFKDLQFKANPHGISARLFFSNGYGVSVIRQSGSYGFNDGLFELAVLQGTAEEAQICYSTPVTNDVLGFLTKENVSSYMREVQELVSNATINN